MSDDNNPVDSSQAFGDTELVFEVVTVFAVNTDDIQMRVEYKLPSNRKWLLTTRITAARPLLPRSPENPSPAPVASPPTPSVSQPTSKPNPDRLIRTTYFSFRNRCARSSFWT